ncbi:flagellar protein FlhE [Kosakonia radicincitans]|uniref:flagellar protein FlhE n=1 Tax=Kosakonia TaxID=1330547 RepID=UPI0008BE60A2|nr:MULTISPECIES: flagellar protein FlhE [Kosakonia]APG19360.1 flagellar protein FlhE [Kosakonia radicincitans]MDD7996497.1 flagellar protein FlhE [Kosakonia radicincitans]NCF08055.1 flagellar protein FlhE [Kosakonia sp. MH5]PTA88639.1 flagellar protein FlhE [Kosakonia sp. H7A]QEM90293.1 flagellar protein FlhE [Kosakonia radicincitans]
MIPAAAILGMALVLPANAAPSSGSWSDTAAGGSTRTGKQIVRGRALSSPSAIPASAKVTRVSWRITLLAPPPPGLEIKLCRHDRCLRLPSLAGQRSITFPLSATGEFRFIYTVNKRGPLRPALNVVNQQLIVNYR